MEYKKHIYCLPLYYERERIWPKKALYPICKDTLAPYIGIKDEILTWILKNDKYYGYYYTTTLRCARCEDLYSLMLLADLGERSY